MQKRYVLLCKVLKHLQNAGILDEIILVGSWCMYFYKDYFTEEKSLKERQEAIVVLNALIEKASQIKSRLFLMPCQ